jgi:C-terminal processing protease CtpA/Prc
MAKMKMFIGFLLFPTILLAQKAIGFRVDVTSAGIVATQVGIRGGTYPLSWSKSLMLEDKDGDGVYACEVIFPNDNVSMFEYKFILDEKQWELGLNNRIWIEKISEGQIDVWNQQRDISPDMLPLIAAKNLQNDLYIFRQAVQLHPGLMRYLTPDDTSIIFNEAHSYFNQPRSYKEAFLRFSKLAASIRCGHTFASYFNQNSLIQQVLFNRADKLPLLFTWIEKRMIITDPLSYHLGLQRGDEIIRINGIAVNAILDTLIPYIKADGDNDAKRIHSLGITGFESFEGFDVFFPLLFPPPNNVYEMEVQTDMGLKKISVNAIAASSRNAMRQIPSSILSANNPVGWHYNFLNDSIASLVLPTFSTYTTDFAWEKYIKETFDEFRKKKIKHLWIDIRGNEGGDDAIPFMIAKQIATKPITSEPSMERIAYEKIPGYLLPYCFSWDEKYKDFSGKLVPLAQGGYTWKKEETTLTIPKNPNAYNGKIYLITDAANSSATYYMARLMRYNQIGVLAGETTGGDMRGINGGQIIFFRMPNTGIEIDIPVYGTYYATNQSGGVIPDIIVKTTIADIKNGKDPVKEKLLENIIRKL